LPYHRIVSLREFVATIREAVAAEEFEAWGQVAAERWPEWGE